ncbi:MAG TPA: recombinase family protein [Candidatus Acidoferrum sp.]
MSLRCAIYSRYSTDKQNPLSIDDQVRKCSEFAQRNGWLVLDGHIYADEAMSGTSDDRAGLKRLLAAATQSAPQFDCILIDDTSRLSRKLGDSLRIFDQLRFSNVRLVFVSQGIDTDSEQAEVLLATHGIVDSLYIRELAKKTHRGVEGRALQGFHTGGRCFGYRGVPIEDASRLDSYGRPQIVGVKLEIDPEQSIIVKRIFAEYADGHSIKAIAKRFNREHVKSPSPYRGQRHPSWAPSALSVILHNERYCGVAIWNRTRKVLDPRTGRRVQRARPRSEWTVVEAAHLSIVSRDVWEQVQARLVSQNKLSTGTTSGLLSRSYTSKYLFSGFLKCGLCGSNIVLISGRGGVGWAKYGCPLHQTRGICDNAVVVRRDRLESELMAGFYQNVLREDIATLALEEFKRQLKARMDDARSHLSGMRQRREKLKAEIANLASVIANGHNSAALLDELGNRERELEAISDDLFAADGRGFDAKLASIEEFVQRRLQDVREFLHADVPRAKSELAKHCTAITLTPESETFRISGNWNLLGGRSDGAGGQNRTGYARLFRAALISNDKSPHSIGECRAEKFSPSQFAPLNH